MGRHKDIFKTPEYRHIEENLDDILKELEEDEEYKDLTLPEEWDREFREAMENAQKESRKKRKRRQILAAAAAVVVLIGVSAVGLGTKAVQGDGILALFESSVEIGDKRYVEHGTDGGMEISDDSASEVVFAAQNPVELYQQIEDELKTPFFRLEWIPEEFHIQEAVYNRDYKVLNIEFGDEDQEEWFYISEESILSHGTKSGISDNQKLFDVQNTSLEEKIGVYKSIKDNLIMFEIERNNIRLDFVGNVTEKNVKEIAGNIIFE